MAFRNPHLMDPGQAVEAASRSSRLWARLIDSIVWFAPLPLLFFSLPGVVALICGFVAILVWQVWLLVTRGQTIGKQFMGIYIMRNDGDIPNFGWIVVREFAIPAAVGIFHYAGHNDPNPIGQVFQTLLYFVWLIDILFIFGRTRRCLHDRVAGTHVVMV
jgi:uncharacterized RDD family membrane protein YckC